MTSADIEWEKRISGAIGLFERGAAFDSTGHPDQAVPLYKAALEAGLTGEPAARRHPDGQLGPEPRQRPGRRRLADGRARRTA
jgi:hypothetical protein